MVDIFKKIKRYNVFDSKSYGHLIKILRTMTTYSMESPVKAKIEDYYYDNADGLLLKNSLILRKRVFGSKANLRLKRRYFDADNFYMDNLRSREREKEIKAHDPLSKHFFFLNNALNSMFSNNLQFDPDKLFEQMRVTMILKIKQEKITLFGYGGLKVEIMHEVFKIQNLRTKRKNISELVQFKLLSADETLPLFEDLITRIERHCKEIFFTKDSKHEMGLKLTKPLLSKEEQKKRHDELMRQRMMEESEGSGK